MTNKAVEGPDEVKYGYARYPYLLITQAFHKRSCSNWRIGHCGDMEMLLHQAHPGSAPMSVDLYSHFVIHTYLGINWMVTVPGMVVCLRLLQTLLRQDACFSVPASSHPRALVEIDERIMKIMF